MDGEDVGCGMRKNEEGVASVSKISSSSCFLRHKRSKSTTDKNLDVARNGTSYCVGKDCADPNESLHIVRSHGAQDSTGLVPNNVDASFCHRASLENDIRQLQMNLNQEKSVHVMLERAIGRASSTLSPGHRHLATQTKELISEIELLEEEIANREQYVLSLYRSIFEQCISAPSSAQSSGMTSPAHTTTGARKHPSIISSTFCSSKKFPLKSFNIMASVKESAKSNLLPKPNVRNETLSRGNTKFHIKSNFSDSIEKIPFAGKSYLTRTLKDHLYQCPSKLSEELVKCMAAIYCWVGSKAPPKPEEAHSPFLSRSSTSVILPRRGPGESQKWSCQSMVEVSSISMDKNHFSSASCAISNYRLLVEQLERVDASALENRIKLAFWVNVYNSLVMHAYLAYGIPCSSLRRMALFHKAAYNIGGHTISANSIENSILCCRVPRVGRWYESIISTAMRKKYGEEKQLSSKFSLFTCQPLVLFALCNGAASDPMLRVYTPKNIIEELEKAKKEFLQTNVVVKKSRKIYLPKILERFAKEASLSFDDLPKWVSENVEKVNEAIQKCSDFKNKRKTSQFIEWLPFDTTFRYVFEKDLTEKPWWV